MQPHVVELIPFARLLARSHWVGRLAFLAALSLAGPALPGVAGDTIVDSFEGAEIDQQIWNLFQAPPERVSISREQSAFGQASLAIRVEPSDDGRFCHEGCQRIEVREAAGIQLPAGSEVWYGLSFKLSAEVARIGSVRWVVGQWKQRTDGFDPSPFLAQRFDNGVFHLTVEDEGCRSVVATAEGDYSALLVLQQAFARPQVGLLAMLGFPDNNRANSLCPSDVQVEPGDVEYLPDPSKEWVRMIYRVRAARDGDGLIEIYGNGQLVARVTGSIGYATTDDARQYFKIGHYRDWMAGPATVYVDCFVRTFNRQDAFGTSGCGPAAERR